MCEAGTHKQDERESLPREETTKQRSSHEAPYRISFFLHTGATLMLTFTFIKVCGAFIRRKIIRQAFTIIPIYWYHTRNWHFGRWWWIQWQCRRDIRRIGLAHQVLSQSILDPPSFHDKCLCYSNSDYYYYSSSSSYLSKLMKFKQA